MPKEKKKIRLFETIFMIFLILLNIYTINFLYKRNKEEKKTQELIDKIEYVPTPEMKDEENKEELFNNTMKEKIRNAKNTNSDTVGWIIVNNTKIDYPFVKTTDNDFYLNHSLDKTTNSSGWVFMDYRTLQNVSKVTVLYGHNRLTGTMFGTLKNLLKEKDNSNIYIYTEETIYTYKVFSTYISKKENYYLKKSFNGESDFNEFINTIKRRSNYDYNVDISYNDKLLTLSTCSGTSNRLAVHAKLIETKSY